jgi:peptidyl-prolyl cis-trans isomerase D
MLNQLRSLTKTWVAAVFVAVLVMSFAVWGVADIFTGRVSDSVARVGDQNISINRFAAEFERELNRFQQETGQTLDRATAVSLGMDRAVLGRLALNVALDLKARQLGLTASPSAVARALAEIPAFADPITGRFDSSTYYGLLQQNRMTPQEFERDLRLDLIQRQLTSTLGSGVRASDVLRTVRVRYVLETRGLSAVVIPPEAAGDIAEPTPEELATYYGEVESSFATPPRRAFTFVTLTLDDFIPDAPVDEAELEAAYEQRRNELATPERRDITEISAPDETTAQQVAERLRAGEDPQAIATALGLGAPQTYDEALPSDLLSSELADAAFAGAQGDVVGPIDGGIAWFVARVDGITAGEAQSLDDLRATLSREIASAAAGDILFDAIDAFERARSQGASIEAAASAAHIPSFSYGPVDQQGAGPEGARASVLSLYPEIVRAAFSLDAPGATSELLPLGEDGYVMVRVDEILPAAVRPLAEVEPQVRAQYALTRRSEALDALVETARASLAGGASPTDAAAAASPSARGEVSELQRAQATPSISRELLARLFNADIGEALVGATADGGRVAVRVDSIGEADEPPPEQLETLRGTLEQELLEDLQELFVRGLQAAYPVQEHPDQIAQATGVSAQR